MKLLFTFLACALLYSGSLFGQETDAYQPDSVMKANGVKTKISYHENAISKSKLIYRFDREGRLTEFALTSNTKENETQFKILYTYNAAGKLAQEEYIPTGEPASRNKVTEYVYSAGGGFTATEYEGKKRTKVSETLFSADSAKRTTRFFAKGQVIRENISYYEKPLYTNRFKGFEAPQDKPKVVVIAGKTYTLPPAGAWDYTFENKFDALGRITERTRKVKGEVQDRSFYTYNSEGLLISKRNTTYYNGNESSNTELLKYEKW